jgi:hypothetical protein
MVTGVESLTLIGGRQTSMSQLSRWKQIDLPTHSWLSQMSVSKSKSTSTRTRDIAYIWASNLPQSLSISTIMTWNLMHLARILKDAGGYPNHGNNRNAWKAGCRFDYENPEHRV